MFSLLDQAAEALSNVMVYCGALLAALAAGRASLPRPAKTRGACGPNARARLAFVLALSVGLFGAFTVFLAGESVGPAGVLVSGVMLVLLQLQVGTVLVTRSASPTATKYPEFWARVGQLATAAVSLVSLFYPAVGAIWAVTMRAGKFWSEEHPETRGRWWQYAIGV